MVLTPTYHVMEMYNVHQDATLLPMSVISTDYVVGKEKLAAISASASRDQNGITHITLVNIDARQAQEAMIDIRGTKFSGVMGRILTSALLQDHNTFDKPNYVKPTEFKSASLNANTLKVKLPPFSIVVLELKP